MQLKKLFLPLLAMALVLGAAPVLAEEEKSDNLARVVMITPKAGHEEALEESITKYHHYMGNKEGAWRYNWYSVVTGPDTGKYLARSGGHSWADFDVEFKWGKEAGKKFRAEVWPHIEDADVYITEVDDEVGIWPDDMDGYQYYSVTKWYIKSGKGREFNEGLKKVDAILKEGGWPNFYAFTYEVSGGNGNTVTIVSPRKNFADMAPKEPAFMDILKKAMGEEEAEAFMKDWGETFKSGQNQLLKWEPKLSDYGDKK